MKFRSSPSLIAIASLQITSLTPAIAAPPTTIEEARQCLFFVTNLDADGEAQSWGSAFVVEDEGVQWIYTNAHVISGASRIEINDQDGDPVTEFGRFSCYASGNGEVDITPKGVAEKEVIRYGGDGVRIELKTKRKLAFKISHDPKVIQKGVKVVTLGDNDGDKTLETLEGEITQSNGKVVLSTCKIRGGSSGGALLDAVSLKVIGLNTWGVPNTVKALDTLWTQDEDHQGEKENAGASIIHAAEWVDISAAEFLKGAKAKREFLNVVAVLSLIYQTTPTESGFAVNMNAPFAAGLTFGQAFEIFENDQILRPVADLNKKLGRGRNSRIKVNNMEIVSTYAKAISSIRAAYLIEADRILKKTPPYYRIDLEKAGLIPFGNECHEGLANAESWFSEKAGAGGIMPLGRWVHLPPLSEFSE